MVVRSSNTVVECAYWTHVTLQDKMQCYDGIQSASTEYLKDRSDFERIQQCLNDETILDYLCHKGWTKVRNSEGRRKRHEKKRRMEQEQ